MQRPPSPWRLIGLAAGLETVGVLLPWLMVSGVLQSTWAWNILAFLSSVSGLFIGSIGMVMYVQMRRARRNPLESMDDYPEDH